MYDRVLFVERSGELRMLARLSTEGAEPKGNRVLKERRSSEGTPVPAQAGAAVSIRRPETG